MPLGMEVGLGQGHIVSDSDPAPLRKGAQQRSPFLAHIYCGQTAGWIRIPLGTEVGLGPGDIVLNGDPGPRPLFGEDPNYGGVNRRFQA